MDRVGVLCRVAQATRLMRATTPRASLRLESLRLNICKDNAPLRPPSVAHKRARQSEVAHKDNELCPIRSSRFPRGDRRYPPRGTSLSPSEDSSGVSPRINSVPPKGHERSLRGDTSNTSEGTPATPPTGHQQRLRRDTNDTSPETDVSAPEGTSKSPYSEVDSAYSPPPLQTHYLYRPCALTESPLALLPRALTRSYRER